MNNQPEWSALNARQASDASAEYEGGSLKALLLTSFDALDTKLLVDHLLPDWCNISRGSPVEGGEQTLFFLELHDALRSAERLVVVSSNPPNGTEPYPWLWRLLRPARVGATGPAVQHAKLWMFLREYSNDDGQSIETLEICISSANLTMSAVRGQIQAGWRCVLKLNRQRSMARRRSWGILPEFIVALAESCGKNREPEIKYFAELLERAECPDQVDFLASVPGKFTPAELRKSPWGQAGLKEIMPERAKIAIVTPTSGSWPDQGLSAWTSALGSSPERLSLFCISKNLAETYPPWKQAWTLAEKTVGTIERAGASLVTFQTHEDFYAPFLHLKHLAADPRWLHAKLYGFSNGQRHSLLITSANFTVAAWGRQTQEGLGIDNFELGVLLKQVKFPFEMVPIEREQIHCQALEIDVEPTSIWAEIEWDGDRLEFSIRSESVPQSVSIEWISNGQPHLDAPRAWPLSREIDWPDPLKIPVQAQVVLSTGNNLCVPILDVRPPDCLLNSPLPLRGIADDMQERLRDALILEKYGGYVASEDGASIDPNGEPAIVGESADYSVHAFVQFREWCNVIDNWQRSFETGDRVCLSDANILLTIFHRQFSQEATSLSDKNAAAAGVRAAGKIAHRELTVRLDRAKFERRKP